jgi:hypothetical protein
MLASRWIPAGMNPAARFFSRDSSLAADYGPLTTDVRSASTNKKNLPRARRLETGPQRGSQLSVGRLRLSGRSWPRRPCGAEQSGQPGQRPGLAESGQPQGRQPHRQPGHTTSSRWCSRCRNHSSLRSTNLRNRSSLRSSSTCSNPYGRTSGSGSNPSCSSSWQHNRKPVRSSRPGNRSWLRSKRRRRSSRRCSTGLRNRSWLRSSCLCSTCACR